jgi:hypothetical protein
MKSDKLTLDTRVRSVAEWMLMGYSTKDIIAQGTSKWQIDERQVYKYIKSAYKLFSDARKADIESRIDFHVAARMKLFNEIADKKTAKGSDSALRILDSIARLEGCVVEKVDVTSKGKQIKGSTTVVKTYNADLTL